ncbi:MAG: phenylacetate--CoA ligase family protein [Halorientalis sp.]
MADIATAPWKQIRATQLDRFRTQVQTVREESAFYRDRLADIDVDDIEDVDDLVDLPVVTKDEVRQSLAAHPPLGAHACVDYDEVVQVQSSSGTTGRPTYVGVSESDLAEWRETVAEVFRTNGMEPGESCLHALGLSKGFVGGIPILQGLEELGVTVLPIGAEAGPERLLHTIADLEPENLVATPNFVQYLGQQAPAVLGREAAELSIERVVCGGEPGLDAMREDLGELWGGEIRQIMGATEIAPAYFAECAHENLHMVRPDRYLPEIVDLETGEQLPWTEGTTGEILLTTLTREVTPMIRYRLGDIVTVTATDCPCGRTMPAIHCHGRTDEMLIVRGVNVFPSALQDVITDVDLPITGEFRIRKPFQGHATKQRLPLVVEREMGHADEGGDIAEHLVEVIQSRLGVATEIEIVEPGTIERPDEDEKVSLIIEE